MIEIISVRSFRNKQVDVNYMCTIFSVSKGNEVFFGNNEDNIRKKDETFIAFIPSQKVPAKWVYPDRDEIVTSYGFMLLGVREGDKILPQGGMNEYGLAYDINGLPLVPFNGVEGIPWKGGFNYFDLLMNTKNIDEVIEHFKTFKQRPHQWGAGQIHFADVTGKAVVIGINEKGDLGFTFKGTKDYLISTNFSLNNPNNTYGFPCRRYEIASKKLEILSRQSQIDKEDCVDILDTVKFQYGKLEENHGTVYGNVFDLVKRKIYLYHLDDFSNTRIFQLDAELKQIEKNMGVSKYTFKDNSIKERFNFVKIQVQIIKDLFS